MVAAAHSSSEIPATLLRLVFVRWWVLSAIALVCLLAPSVLGITLPQAAMFIILGVASGWNLMSQLSLQRNPEFGGNPVFICSQLIFELVLLSALLFLSGGATNPFIFMLLTPVAIAALTLPPSWVAGIAVLAVFAYSALSLWFLPLAIADPIRGASLHLAGMWVSFVASVSLIGWLVSRLNTMVRQREADLLQAREKVLRDERVLALGTLAASAAHELGTPLGTLTLLVDELANASDAPVSLEEDLALMRQQLAHCKHVITGLTEAAGVAREEHAELIAAGGWLRTRFEQWILLRQLPNATLNHASSHASSAEIIVNAALTHGLFNLLDNALRAGPPILVTLTHADNRVVISIKDSGPGFSPTELQQAARQPFSAHERGTGVGLILTRASAEHLGGTLELGNDPGGGACVQLILPVARIPDHG